MITNGAIIKTDCGRETRIERLMKSGGQGITYLTTDLADNHNGVVKIFHDKYSNVETRHRIRYLINQDLQKKCPALAVPIESIFQGHITGHYTPFVPGLSLEEYLAKPEFSFVNALCVGVGLTQIVSILHQNGIAYGDIHAENFIIDPSPKVTKISGIDFDNFSAAQVPPPPMLGRNLYVPPEIRSYIGKAERVNPTLKSDVYELAVLLHEVILLYHPATGCDGNAEEFERAMSGIWMHDPAMAKHVAASKDSYPVTVLNNELQRLFRKSFSRDPNERPSIDDWQRSLARAATNVFVCPQCDCPAIVDSSKTACPLCNQPYPTLKIRIDSDGREFKLKQSSLVLGRRELGGSEHVSARHAIFRRLGPDTWLESMGRNGSYRWSGSDWIRLPDGKPVLIQSNDKLRLADVDVIVV